LARHCDLGNWQPLKVNLGEKERNYRTTVTFHLVDYSGHLPQPPGSTIAQHRFGIGREAVAFAM
jgi:hypothetical protein